MIAADVITEARRDLADEGSTKRWANSELWGFMVAGMNYIWDTRPDARFDDDGEYVTGGLTLPTMAGETLPPDVLNLDDRFAVALTHYVAYRALLNDTDDEGNARKATMHLQLWNDALSKR